MKAIAAFEWLKIVHAFRALSSPALKQIYAQCHALTVAQGETLYQQGDPAAALHVVLQGRFRIVRAGSESFSEVGPGAAMGEVAFFTRGRSRETAVAIRESVALRLEWGEFEPLARRMPELWQGVASALALALETTGATQPARRFDRPKTLAIASAGLMDIPPVFFTRLAEALDERADCQLLSPEGLGQNLAGGIALDDPEASHWLGEQEDRFDLVIALTGVEPGEWARKAITEADEVLLVGVHEKSRAGAPVPLNPIEELAFAIRGGEVCRLALLHESGLSGAETSVNGARRWLEHRPVRSHHHVGVESPGDYQRLVRFILGQSVGFIASGEGAFAAVNLGMVKALQASGVTFDVFAGTGGGVAIAACLAMGMDPDDIDAMIMEILARKKPFGRKTPPRYGLFDGRAFDRLIVGRIPEADVADLRLPFYAVSTNISTGETVIQRRGGLHRILRINWPPAGLLPPFVDEEGQIMASGSLSDPLPVAPMRAMKDGPNFLCAPKLEPVGRSPLAYHQFPSRLRLRLSGLAPFGGEGPAPQLALENMLARAFSLGQTAAAERAAAADAGGVDVLFTPPVVSAASALDWKLHGAIKDEAYQWGLAEIERRSPDGRTS
jgi:NTE family protein